MLIGCNYTAFIIILLCAIPFNRVHAQQNNYFITTQHLSVEDGLASREIFCGVQDKLGFLWFGTRNGLNRYDGEKFLLFSRQHNHMQENKVLQLAVDDRNRLFIGYGLSGYSLFPSGHIDVMDAVTQKVNSLTETFPDLPFKESEVFTIANEGTDKLAIITVHPARFWYYSSKTGFRLRYTMKDQPMESVRQFGFQDASFWHGYAHLPGHVNYEITPDTAYRLVNSPDIMWAGLTLIGGKGLMPYVASFKDHLRGYCILDSPGHFHWLADPKPFTDSSEMAPISSPTDTARLMKSKDGIYSYTRQGFVKLLDSSEVSGYKDRIFTTSFFDGQGSRWLFSEGAIKVKLRPRRFHTYFTKQQQHIEGNNQARGIYADDKGKVYANIWNRLFIQDSNKTTEANSLGILYALLKFNDKIIAGEYRLDIYNQEKNSLSRVGNSGLGGEIWSIIPLSDSILLLGGSIWIAKYDFTKDSIKEIPVLNPNIPKPSFVYRFIRDNGMIWACAANGLYKLDEMGSITGYYGNLKDKSHYLPFSDLFDFCIDKNGTGWLATNGEGLYRWDCRKNEFRQFTVADGLSSNVLYRIETDDYDNLWISSDFGLIRFNTRNYNTYTYTTNDGLSHNEFNRGSSFKAADGRLFFGGLNGVNAFYPKDMLSDTAANETPLRVISFTKFSSVKDKLLDLSTDLILNNKIVVNTGDRFIELKFLLLDFEAGKKRYAYKIEGLDKDWNYTNENSIRLSGLPFGDFTLRIKGQNCYGAWSKCELSIPLVVVTPFYRSSWFILAVILVLITATYFLVYVRTKQLEAEKNKLESIVGERTAQLKQSLEKQYELLREKDVLMKEIHHRVKNNLQVISGLLELQSKSIADEDTRNILREGRNRVGSIALIHQNLYQMEHFSAVDLVRFVKDLCIQVSEVFKDSVPVTIKTELLDLKLDIDTAVPLGLILNELLSNSYKYAFHNTSEGEIVIKMSLGTKDSYKMTYQDNGPGLPAGFDINKCGSLGMLLIYDLARQIGGKVQYETKSGAYFIFTFTNREQRKKSD